MTTTTPGARDRAALDEFEPLFDALLYAVSHDLKSPLLSIGLGAELLAGSTGGDERTRLALEAMQRGAEDLTRLLEALTLVSRARRRPLDASSVALAGLLAGTVAGEDARVRVDPRLVTEFAAAMNAPMQVRLGDSEVLLSAAWPADAPVIGGAPLGALFASLGLHAGTLVGTLAVLQVQLERQGGTIVVGGGQATALLPRGD